MSHNPTDRETGRQADKQKGRRRTSQVASRWPCPWQLGPPAPATKSGVRKKRASETYLKTDVLLMTNDDLRALRVQNENQSERRDPIFRKRAGSPACGGGACEEERPRAARRKSFFWDGLRRNSVMFLYSLFFLWASFLSFTVSWVLISG